MNSHGVEISIVGCVEEMVRGGIGNRVSSVYMCAIEYVKAEL